MAAFLALGLITGTAFGVRCRDVQGRFFRCSPAAAATIAYNVDEYGRCRNAKGRLRSCPKIKALAHSTRTSKRHDTAR